VFSLLLQAPAMATAHDLNPDEWGQCLHLFSSSQGSSRASSFAGHRQVRPVLGQLFGALGVVGQAVTLPATKTDVSNTTCVTLMSSASNVCIQGQKTNLLQAY
jgi:hypothetical protein